MNHVNVCLIETEFSLHFSFEDKQIDTNSERILKMELRPHSENGVGNISVEFPCSATFQILDAFFTQLVERISVVQTVSNRIFNQL